MRWQKKRFCRHKAPCKIVKFQRGHFSFTDDNRISIMNLQIVFLYRYIFSLYRRIGGEICRIFFKIEIYRKNLQNFYSKFIKIDIHPFNSSFIDCFSSYTRIYNLKRELQKTSLQL